MIEIREETEKTEKMKRAESPFLKNFPLHKY